MVTPEDMQANAEFVRLADHHIDALGEFWPLLGPSSLESGLI